MSDTGKQSGLESARARLEAALSTLTQGVASSRDALGLAAADALEKASQTEALTARITALEQENLKLHEQVAAFALQPEPAVDIARVSELEAEKEAIDQNYRMLKEKYAVQQDELDALTATSGNNSDENAFALENIRLKQIVAEMEQEKSAIKEDLDKTIVDLETMLEDA